MLKVSIIGSVGIPAKYGGFETLVEHLSKKLSKQYILTVYCSAKNYKKKLNYYNSAKLEYINLQANGIQSIFYDLVSFVKAMHNSDVILILGVSGCIGLPLLKPFTKAKIVTNIDGLEWKRDKWSSIIKSFLRFSEKLAVKFSDRVIGDNKVIIDYIHEQYRVKNTILIPYGADHVSNEIMSKEIISRYSFLKDQYAFKVCRIEPENNIHIILEAFREIKTLNLVIVGNWNNSDYGTDLKSKYSGVNIHLLDPIYDQKILNQMRSNCYVYIHGHSAGGTNPSLVEAMYLKLPIISYGVKYNKETTNNECMYFLNKNELVYILDNLNNDKLMSIRQNMYRYAKENYTWEIIASSYSKAFHFDE